MAEHISIRGLDATIKALQALPVELGSKGGGPVRGALFAASREIRDDAKSRAPVGKSTPNPGNLRAQVFVKRDPNPKAIGATEHYIISVRSGRRGLFSARVGGATRALTRQDAFYWWYVEFGTSKQPAQPFLRPAFEANKRRAVLVFGRELRKSVSKATARARRVGGSL